MQRALEGLLPQRLLWFYLFFYYTLYHYCFGQSTAKAVNFHLAQKNFAALCRVCAVPCVPTHEEVRLFPPTFCSRSSDTSEAAFPRYLRAFQLQKISPPLNQQAHQFPGLFYVRFHQSSQCIVQTALCLTCSNCNAVRSCIPTLVQINPASIQAHAVGSLKKSLYCRATQITNIFLPSSKNR